MVTVVVPTDRFNATRHLALLFIRTVLLLPPSPSRPVPAFISATLLTDELLLALANVRVFALWGCVSPFLAAAVMPTDRPAVMSASPMNDKTIILVNLIDREREHPPHTHSNCRPMSPVYCATQPNLLFCLMCFDFSFPSLPYIYNSKIVKLQVPPIAVRQQPDIPLFLYYSASSF